MAERSRKKAGKQLNCSTKPPVKKVGAPTLTLCGLKQPWGVAVNQKGEVIVTESGGHCVSVFSPTGEKLRSFGSDGSGLGQFNYPHGVAVDGVGNILVTDSGNNRVQKFTPEGFLTAVGADCKSPPQYFYPMDIAFNTVSKKAYVTDTISHCVQVLNYDLTFFSSFGKRGSGKGQFNYPHGIACDSTGKVYVADSDNHRIQVFTVEGKFLRMFHRCGDGTGELTGPEGVAIDSNNMVYVSEFGCHRVSVFTPEGVFVTSFGSHGEGPGEFTYPRGLAVDNSGFVYVCDHYNHRVQIF